MAAVEPAFARFVQTAHASATRAGSPQLDRSEANVQRQVHFAS
jgi:hypothetical protein